MPPERADYGPDWDLSADWAQNLARYAALGTLAPMQQRCEVCENFRPEGDLKPGRTLEEVTYGNRRVLLCRAHAGIAQNSGVTTFQELRELYSEQHGARSYVPRRTRTAPANAAKKSRTPGRRVGDSA